MFGVNVDPTDAEQAVEIAAHADSADLDLLTCQDHPYLGHHLEMWTLLTTLAISTSRVRVMPNVANLPLRPPAVLAKAAATLARLTDGRVELGLGAGARWDAITAYGGPRRSPGQAVTALAEAIEVIRQLTDPDRESAQVDGEHYHLDGARPGPRPEQPIRIWVGAYGPRMLGLTGRLADGWTPTNRYAPPERIREMQAAVDRGAEEAGRDPADIRRNYNLMGVIDADAPRQDGKQLTGPADHWVDTMVRYAEDLRFDTFVFWPTGDALLDQIRAFAYHVAPEVRQRLDADPAARGTVRGNDGYL